MSIKEELFMYGTNKPVLIEDLKVGDVFYTKTIYHDINFHYWVLSEYDPEKGALEICDPYHPSLNWPGANTSSLEETQC